MSPEDEVVIVRASQSLELTKKSYYFRKLIMEDRAKLILKNPSTTIIVDSAYFGQYCSIEGKGAAGKHGRKGANGKDYGYLPQNNHGGKGEFGEFGGAGADLQLAMTVIEQETPLRILLQGGTGGNGGNGGNGGWRNARCGATTTGATGGDGGNGGRGGRGGVLKIMAESSFEGPIYQLFNKQGKDGKPGLGGYPGRIKKITCPPARPAKIVQGEKGEEGTVLKVVLSSPGSKLEKMNFPVPPPSPSEKILLPLSMEQFSTLKELDEVLGDALRASGYEGQISYLNYPGGYALVTRLERINEDGTALKQGRFDPNPSFVTEFSLTALIKALFTAREGYFRLIAFIVTDETTGGNPEGVSRKDALAWFKSGDTRLPPDIGIMPIGPKHRIEALIYEFTISENGTEAVMSEPSKLTAQEHLQRATIWAKLKL